MKIKTKTKIRDFNRSKYKKFLYDIIKYVTKYNKKFTEVILNNFKYKIFYLYFLTHDCVDLFKINRYNYMYFLDKNKYYNFIIKIILEILSTFINNFSDLLMQLYKC